MSNLCPICDDRLEKLNNLKCKCGNKKFIVSNYHIIPQEGILTVFKKSKCGKEYKEKFYTGFNISCDKCNSPRVYIKDTVGFSSISGAWGNIKLVCEDCKNETVISDTC